MCKDTDIPATWRSPAEVAELLSCSIRTVDRAIKDGTLPSFKFRGLRRVDIRVLERMSVRGSKTNRAARPASDSTTGNGPLPQPTTRPVRLSLEKESQNKGASKDRESLEAKGQPPAALEA